VPPPDQFSTPALLLLFAFSCKACCIAVCKFCLGLGRMLLLLLDPKVGTINDAPSAVGHAPPLFRFFFVFPPAIVFLFKSFCFVAFFFASAEPALADFSKLVRLALIAIDGYAFGGLLVIIYNINNIF